MSKQQLILVSLCTKDEILAYSSIDRNPLVKLNQGVVENPAWNAR